MNRKLISLCLLPLLVFGHWALDFDEDFAAAYSKKAEPVEPVTLTFEYVSTYPATIKIGGTAYGQPADPSKALVDAGDGVFMPWTSNTITVKGMRIRFRGDWRNSDGNFVDLFNGTFAGGYNVTMSGGFDFDGAPAVNMFRSTFYSCSNLTGESALMPDGTTHLYEQFPTASGTDCDNCYYAATGLNDYATMPAAWK